MRQYESLDGIKGNSILVEDRSITTVAGAGAMTVLSRNPRRLWAIIQIGPEIADTLNVFLVPLSAGLTSLVLNPGGSVLFNRDFHFTGEVRVQDTTAAGGVAVRVLEATVME